MAGWRKVHAGIENDGLKIDGIEVWKHKWRSTGELCINLPHPSYRNQIHSYDVYEIEDAVHSVRFAAAELSNGCGAFTFPNSTGRGVVSCPRAFTLLATTQHHGTSSHPQIR
jgi:hypothetical protein